MEYYLTGSTDAHPEWVRQMARKKSQGMSDGAAMKWRHYFHDKDDGASKPIAANTP